MTILKRYRLFLILALSMGLSGCSSTGTEEPPTEAISTESTSASTKDEDKTDYSVDEESDDVESLFTDA